MSEGVLRRALPPLPHKARCLLPHPPSLAQFSQSTPSYLPAPFSSASSSPTCYLVFFSLKSCNTFRLSQPQIRSGFGSSSVLTTVPTTSPVAIVVILQFLQLSFVTDNAWTVCVLGYIDPMNLISPPISAPGTGVLNGMVSLCVQMFFVWKIHSLAQKNKFFNGVAGFIAVLSVVQFAASIAITTKFIMVNREAVRLHELKKPITVHLVTTAVCDTLITMAMITILSHYKENTVFVKTKSLLNTLIITTIENGLITSATAIANLVIYFVRTQDMINIAFQYVIGGLYAIVLVTTLNRRTHVKRGDGGTSISLSDANAFNTSRNNNLSGGRGPVPSYQVNVHTTVDHKSDPESIVGETISSHAYASKQY